ncbi:hypothetical protein WMY93_002460 [Mugilogobius chulae]|uniref:Uncharacterized protein n=1 Tax=Mugilogobius chulae TaxID=88201 RepID=A0AAW0Q4S8_9GOBI
MSLLQVRSLFLFALVLGLSQAFVGRRNFQESVKTTLFRYEQLHQMLKAQYESIATYKNTQVRNMLQILDAAEGLFSDRFSRNLRTYIYESDHILDLMLQDLKSQLQKYELLIEKSRVFLNQTVAEL